MARDSGVFGYFLGDLRRLRDLGAFGKSEWNPSKQNQITYGQSFLCICTAVSWSRWGSILDLLGSFSSIWVGDNVPGRILGNLNFGVLLVKKFKLRSAENIGYGCRNGSVSEKVQKFCERSILMKCSLLYRGLSRSIQFLIFQNFCMVFRWG